MFKLVSRVCAPLATSVIRAPTRQGLPSVSAAALQVSHIRLSSRTTRRFPSNPSSKSNTYNEQDDGFARGSRPAYVSGKFDNPKKLKHRQSVEKRVLYLQRQAHKKLRNKTYYGGLRDEAMRNEIEGLHLRALPKKIHTDAEIERYVKRRELHRLLPFKKAANKKQWKILGNADKQPDDETIKVLQNYKAQKEIDPNAKPEKPEAQF